MSIVPGLEPPTLYFPRHRDEAVPFKSGDDVETDMNRYTVALCALVAVVALAGCGTPGGTGTPTESPTATPNATAGGPYDVPLNGTVVTEGHRAAIDDAGRFRYRQSTTVRAVPSGASIQYRNVTAAVNRDTGVYRATENTTTNPPADIYVDANGTAFLRQRFDDRIAYDRQVRDRGGSDPYAYPPVGRYLDGLSYSYNGTQERGGTTVHVYEADGLDGLDPDEHGLTALDPGNLSTLSADLWVTDSGRVQAFRYEVAGTNRLGNQVRFTVALQYSGVGSTTVTEPGWTTEAEQVTSG
jgi:hypothetical protein